MADSLTYADALKILGFQKGRLLSFLNAVTSAGLAIWATSAIASGQEAGAPLELYEVKNDILSLAREVSSKFSTWRTGVSRFHRSERLAAAHAVLVIASFYERLDALADFERLGMTRGQMAVQATGGRPPDSYVDLISVLVEAKLPLPEPHRPYTEVRKEIIEIHRLMGKNLTEYVRNTAAWAKLSKTGKAKLVSGINQAADSAISYYDQEFYRLAADSREFAVWASLTETHALGTGLAALTELLNAMMSRSSGDRPRAHLFASYRTALDEPVAASDRAPEGVVLPRLGEAYVDPHYKISEVSWDDIPASDSWWDKKATQTDFQSYFTGYLTSLRATRAPLIVLGEPGSGKSKLTEIIAARLSDTDDFLPIRVELRNVSAESMIQAQIEQAIVHDNGEHVSWHDLLAAAPRALPVVLLDGFDELLQATNNNRYDYLEQVAEFQRRQKSIGHAIAVIVTSRTVVADRARFPPGSLALRLLPFDDKQVRNWLQVWHRYNATPLATRGLIPLTPETAFAHRNLAEQPLLLLILAIYDATDNGLQRDAELHSADLYENLLIDFALREVRKSKAGRAMSDAQQRMAARREIWRLSVVALAMFVRGQKSVGDVLLNKDLKILFPERNGDEESETGLTPSERATSRFFFVHKSEARPRNERARSYEFLHATFGEFLVAWLAFRSLRDLVSRRESESLESTANSEGLNDGYLFAVLSFRCLTESDAITGFLAGLMGHLTDDERARCRDLLGSLIRDSLYFHGQRSHQNYQPVRLTVPARFSSYSANLFVLLVKLAGGDVDLAEVLGKRELERRWFSYAHLWRGNLSPNEWAGILKELNPGTGPIIRLYRDGSTVALFASNEFGII